MHEGMIGRWLLAEGAKVIKDQPIVEIVTDKTVFELQAPKAGILRKISAPENSVVPPGFIIALLGNETDELPDIASHNAKLMSKFSPAGTSIQGARKQTVAAVAYPSDPGRVRATPSAKRMAKTHGLNLVDLAAYSKNEVITEKMVLDYIKNNKG